MKQIYHSTTCMEVDQSGYGGAVTAVGISC